MTKRYFALDGWRGIGAIAILFFHFPKVYHFPDLDYVRSFYLFVDFFFVLSGFVITHSYQDKIRTAGDGLRFLSLRLGRIYPLHLVTLVLTIMVLSLIDIADFASGWAVNHQPDRPLFGFLTLSNIGVDLLLLQAMGIDRGLHLNYPSWAISAEFYVYVLFAILLVSSKKLLQAALAIAALGGPLLIWAVHENMDTTYDYGFIRALCGFSLGYWVYQARARISIAPGVAFMTAVELACILLLLVFMGVAGIGPLSVLAPYIFTVMVVVFSFDGGWISRILGAKPLLRLGELSFSIYLMQAPFVYAGDAIIKAADGAWGLRFGAPSLAGDALFAIFVVLVLMAARVAYARVELPNKSVFANMLDRLRHRRGEAQSS